MQSRKAGRWQRGRKTSFCWCLFLKAKLIKCVWISHFDYGFLTFGFAICVLSTENSMALVWISNYANNFCGMDNMCWYICTKDEIIHKIFHLFHRNLKIALKMMLSPKTVRMWTYNKLKSCWILKKEINVVTMWVCSVWFNIKFSFLSISLSCFK